jgi:hypothetical protein
MVLLASVIALGSVTLISISRFYETFHTAIFFCCFLFMSKFTLIIIILYTVQNMLVVICMCLNLAFERNSNHIFVAVLIRV